MPSKSNCASSIQAARRETRDSAYPNAPTKSGTAICPDARIGLIYGYRAYGPYNPQEGHRFNDRKLLLDPYARQYAGVFRWSDALFGYRIDSPRGDLSYDSRDSAQGMLKAVVCDDTFDWGDDRPPNVPWSDTVIYEAHVRGMTMLHGEIRLEERGTFAALANSSDYRHLQRLGITAIELLPIQAFLQDRTLVDRGLTNYWGYNTLGFFAIEPRYLSEKLRNEMRIAVRRLHAAGIEVILDVVYNHTAEGSELGPTLSLSRPRQCQLLSARSRQQAAMHQRYRHRQHTEPVASARAADGDGFAALLGEFVPC